MKRYIKVIYCSDDTRSESTIKAPNVTPAMLDACDDLVFTLMTGKRRAPTHRHSKGSK